MLTQNEPVLFRQWLSSHPAFYPALEISIHPYALAFRHPFRLASGSRTHTDTVQVQLVHQGFTGYGEASLPPYLSENVDSVTAFAERVDPAELTPGDDLSDALFYLDGLAIGNRAAKAAFDMALHDLMCKMKGCTLSQYYDISPAAPLATSFTLGISAEAELVEKLKVAEPYRRIKIKLGTSNDQLLVERFLKHSTKPFFADVNQGWTDPGYALDMAHYLHESGALFIEQPLPVHMTEEMAWLAEVCPIDFYADESVQTFDDIPEVIGVFKGINIKLMKCGGLAEAYRMIDFARFMGLKVMMGCMTESSCATTAAAHLAQLADYVDLDGPLLIANDPFTGVRFDAGHLYLPDGQGHGARPTFNY